MHVCLYFTCPWVFVNIFCFDYENLISLLLQMALKFDEIRMKIEKVMQRKQLFLMRFWTHLYSAYTTNSFVAYALKCLFRIKKQKFNYPKKRTSHNSFHFLFHIYLLDVLTDSITHNCDSNNSKKNNNKQQQQKMNWQWKLARNAQ